MHEYAPKKLNFLGAYKGTYSLSNNLNLIMHFVLP
jgi:hypothetical protein